MHEEGQIHKPFMDQEARGGEGRVTHTSEDIELALYWYFFCAIVLVRRNQNNPVSGVVTYRMEISGERTRLSGISDTTARTSTAKTGSSSSSSTTTTKGS